MGNDWEKIIEQKLEKKFNIIQNDLEKKLDNIKKDLMNYFKNNIKETILIEIKQLKNSKIDYHNLENNRENENFLQKQNNKMDKTDKEFEEKKLSDFIIKKNKNNINITYYEPKEIDEENEKITSSINDKVYENYLPEKENLLNETAGKFFYSVGGISRVSQSMANKIYYELFEEYNKYLKKNNEFLIYSHELDRKNLSIWTKNLLKENEFYNYYANKNIQEINKYFYKNDDKTNKIFLELYKNLISLYTKCRLSYPIVKTDYTNNNCDFSAKTMIDCTLKYERNKKVNFCYFPALISNGKFLRNGNYHVLTYSLKSNTFHIDGKIYDFKLEEQMPKLYIIPETKNIKINICQINFGKKSKIKVVIEPSIDPVLNIKYILFKRSYQKNEKIDENNNGIFDIDKGNYYVKILYAKEEVSYGIFEIK